MKKAIMRKEWGEIGLGSKKRNGWAWEVELYEEDGSLYDRRIFDYYNARGIREAGDFARAWDKEFSLYYGEKR